MSIDLFDYDEKQAAQILGVDPRTLRKWRSDGAIGFHRLPGGRIRYTADQLVEFKRSTRVAPISALSFPHSSA